MSMIRSTVHSLDQLDNLAHDAESYWHHALRAQAVGMDRAAEEFARQALDRYIALGWTWAVEMIRIRMGWE
jgi:hypothetical protein